MVQETNVTHLRDSIRRKEREYVFPKVERQGDAELADLHHSRESANLSKAHGKRSHLTGHLHKSIVKSISGVYIDCCCRE